MKNILMLLLPALILSNSSPVVQYFKQLENFLERSSSELGLYPFYNVNANQEYLPRYVLQNQKFENIPMSATQNVNNKALAQSNGLGFVDSLSDKGNSTDALPPSNVTQTSKKQSRVFRNNAKPSVSNSDLNEKLNTYTIVMIFLLVGIATLALVVAIYFQFRKKRMSTKDKTASTASDDVFFGNLSLPSVKQLHISNADTIKEKFISLKAEDIMKLKKTTTLSELSALGPRALV
jgi:cell division protein FtsL